MHPSMGKPCAFAKTRYRKAGKALSETRKDENAGWITEYVYDAAGRIESVKRCIRQF